MAKKMERRDMIFFLLFALSLVLYIHEIVVSSSSFRSKGLGLVAWMCWKLHFRYRGRRVRDVHRDVRRASFLYITDPRAL